MSVQTQTLCLVDSWESDPQHFKFADFKPVPSIQQQLPAMQHPQPWCGKHVANENTPKNSYNYSLAKGDAEKTPMCRVAELARFNKLRHEYVLLDESGPAHKKRFTVKLVLREGEEFEGSGASIKKAQQAAAEAALEKTSLARPISKTKKAKRDISNPVNLLQSVATQLSIAVEYRDETKPFPRHPIAVNSTAAFAIGGFPSMGMHRMPNITPHSASANGTETSLPLRHPLMAQPPTPNGWMPRIHNPMEGAGFFRHQQPSINGISADRSLFPCPNPLLLNNGSMLDNFQRVPPYGYSRVPTPLPIYPAMPFPPPYNFVPPITSKREFVSVAVLSDGTEHAGVGPKMSIAKNNAATKALVHLGPALAELDAKMGKRSGEWRLSSSDSESDPSEQKQPCQTIEDGQPEHKRVEYAEKSGDRPAVHVNHVEEGKAKKSKSVISEIHEYALRLKMNVEFEVLKETGEPHNRRYLLQCRLNSPQRTITADGEGSSKKSAKQSACQQMLEKLKGMVNEKLIPEADPIYLAAQIVKSSKKNGTNNLNKDGKRKTIIKDMKMDPKYGHHINPISRLIQVMQISKQDEPVFTLVSEQGQNRYKEFLVEVNCQGHTECGSGPNKKLAKRAAAEAMLAKIGYVKPMPQPGKSLLKKRSSDSVSDGISPTVDIGVFDMNEFFENAEITTMSEADGDGEMAQLEKHVVKMQTFADVEDIMEEVQGQHVEKSPQLSSKALSASSAENIQDWDGDMHAVRSAKRRVTFSNEVSACPPPEDSNYPEASITPLKSEVVLVSKMKKRGKESKKYLAPEEKQLLASAARLFLSYTYGENTKTGFVSATTPTDTAGADIAHAQVDMSNFVIQSAKDCLEKLAKDYKFTVVYSDFPKTGIDDQNFSLVTIGFEKPIVCHGWGKDVDEDAHNMAAYNAIRAIAMLDMTTEADASPN